MSRPKLVDHWTAARINHLSAEVSRLEGGPIARLFLKMARAGYREYCCFGRPRLRELCWSYLDQVAVQLVGREARSSDQLQGQEAR